MSSKLCICNRHEGSSSQQARHEPWYSDSPLPLKELWSLLIEFRCAQSETKWAHKRWRLSGDNDEVEGVLITLSRVILARSRGKTRHEGLNSLIRTVGTEGWTIPLYRVDTSLGDCTYVRKSGKTGHSHTREHDGAPGCGIRCACAERMRAHPAVPSFVSFRLDGVRLLWSEFRAQWH